MVPHVNDLTYHSHTKVDILQDLFPFSFLGRFSSHWQSHLPLYLSTSCLLRIPSLLWYILWYYHLCPIICKHTWVPYTSWFLLMTAIDIWNPLLLHSHNIQTINIVCIVRPLPTTITPFRYTYVPTPHTPCRDMESQNYTWRLTRNLFQKIFCTRNFYKTWILMNA